MNLPYRSVLLLQQIIGRFLDIKSTRRGVHFMSVTTTFITVHTPFLTRDRLTAQITIHLTKRRVIYNKSYCQFKLNKFNAIAYNVYVFVAQSTGRSVLYCSAYWSWHENIHSICFCLVFQESLPQTRCVIVRRFCERKTDENVSVEMWVQSNQSQ